MFWGSTGCFGAVQDGIGQYRMFWDSTGWYRAVQDVLGQYRMVLGSTGCFGTVQDGIGQYRMFWGSTGWYWAVQDCQEWRPLCGGALHAICAALLVASKSGTEVGLLPKTLTLTRYAIMCNARLTSLANCCPRNSSKAVMIQVMPKHFSSRGGC
eukprot:351899-Chlamydomonas_euryale.AAC.4